MVLLLCVVDTNHTVKILKAQRNLEAQASFIVLTTTSGQSHTQGTKETLNMHHATQPHPVQAQQQVEDECGILAVMVSDSGTQFRNSPRSCTSSFQ